MPDDQDVAKAVALPPPDEHRGAIKVRGYLQVDDRDSPGAPDDTARIYIESSFRVWLRCKREDILYHIPGGTDPCCPMGIVWIKREAPIRKVEAGYAYAIVEPLMMAQDDPAAAALPQWHGPGPPYH
jgi:hypothetical protein